MLKCVRFRGSSTARCLRSPSTSNPNFLITKRLASQGNSSSRSDDVAPFADGESIQDVSENDSTSSTNDPAEPSPAPTTVPWRPFFADLPDFDYSEFTNELAEILPESARKQNYKFKPLMWGWSALNLPASPLMVQDSPPKLKTRHPSKRAVNPQGATKFQRALQRNPYAIALATPVRQCSLTDTVLPRFFMQRFELLGHPETGAPHYVPRSWDEIQGTGMYTLGRYSVLKAVSDDSLGFGKAAYKKLIPRRLRHRSATKSMYNSAVFRRDMHGIVLRVVRGRIMEHMLYLLTLRRGYMRHMKSWEDKEWQKQTAAFLWIGTDKESEEEQHPPEFATMDVEHHRLLEDDTMESYMRKIPVFNLRVLLGEKNLERLRLEAPASTSHLSHADHNTSDWDTRGFFDHPIINIRNRHLTVPLVLDLWWLQGYLAEYKAFLPTKTEDQ